MREEDAKQKWCPLVRIEAVESERLLFTNRINNASELTVISDGAAADLTKAVSRCIGSDCMAWRFEHDPEIYAKVDTLRKKYNIAPMNREGLDFTAGYCGAFGKVGGE